MENHFKYNVWKCIYIHQKYVAIRTIRRNMSGSSIHSVIRRLISSNAFLLWPSTSSCFVNLGNQTLHSGSVRWYVGWSIASPTWLYPFRAWKIQTLSKGIDNRRLANGLCNHQDSFSSFFLRSCSLFLLSVLTLFVHPKSLKSRTLW